MLTVWGRKTSSNVQKVMWAINELNLAHTRMDVGGAFGKTDTPEFIAMNPNRLVPVLEDKGFTMYESNAIVRYLANTYGRGKLAPHDDQLRAKADQWMDWTTTTLTPEISGGIFIPLARVKAADRDNAAVAAAAKRAGEKLVILDAALGAGPYILGPNLSMADIIAGTMMYRYFDMPIARPSLPNVEAWYKRLTGRPAYRDHVMIDWTQLKIPGA